MIVPACLYPVPYDLYNVRIPLVCIPLISIDNTSAFIYTNKQYTFSRCLLHLFSLNLIRWMRAVWYFMFEKEWMIIILHRFFFLQFSILTNIKLIFMMKKNEQQICYLINDIIVFIMKHRAYKLLSIC